MKMLSKRFPRLLAALRPTFEEIEYYARIILQHEGRPASALPDCRREAELQLWADRCYSNPPMRRGRRRGPVAG